MDPTQLEQILFQRKRAISKQPGMSRLGDKIAAAIQYAENFDWENEEPDLLAKVGLLYKKRVEDIRKNIPERQNDTIVEMQNLFATPPSDEEEKLKAGSMLQSGISKASGLNFNVLDLAFMEQDPIIKAVMKPKEAVASGVDSLRAALLNYFGNK